MLRSTIFTQQSRDILRTNEAPAIELLSHDGYDADGPESDIWTLLVFRKGVSGWVADVYHREYWYHGKDTDPYELHDTGRSLDEVLKCLGSRDQEIVQRTLDTIE